MKQIFRLKAIFTFVFLLFCSFNISFGQINPQITLSKVDLTSKVIKSGKDEWKIAFSLENKGNNIIYFADNPTQTRGERGYYVSVNEDNKSIRFSSRVFPPSMYSPYSDYTSVELKKLNIGEIFDGKIFFKFPLKETIPPLNDPYKIKNIVQKKTKQIELTIGYFNEEEGILDFLKTKPFGWFVNGQENIFSGKLKGKSFFEIQNLVTVNTNL